MQQLVDQIRKAQADAKAKGLPLQLDINVFTTQQSKTLAKREVWCDEEFLLLIKMSVMGESRAQMEKVFKRTTGKIFSKIQKHSHMLERVKDQLSRQDKPAGLPQPEALDSLIKFVTIYFNLSKKWPGLPNVPEFLSREHDLSGLTQRVTVQGLTPDEASQVTSCIDLEVQLHTRKPQPQKLLAKRGREHSAEKFSAADGLDLAPEHAANQTPKLKPREAKEAMKVANVVGLKHHHSTPQPVNKFSYCSKQCDATSTLKSFYDSAETDLMS